MDTHPCVIDGTIELMCQFFVAQPAKNGGWYAVLRHIGYVGVFVRLIHPI